MTGFLVDFGTVVVALKWWLIASVIALLVWSALEANHKRRQAERQVDRLLAENARLRDRGRTRVEIPLRPRRPIQRGPVVRP